MSNDEKIKAKIPEPYVNGFQICQSLFTQDQMIAFWKAARLATLEDVTKELEKIPRWKYTISHGDLYGYEDEYGDDISYDKVEEVLKSLGEKQ